MGKSRNRRKSRARGSWWPFTRKLSSGYKDVKDRRWLKNNPVRMGSPDILPVQQMINSEAAWLARTQGRRRAKGTRRRRRSKSRRRRRRR
jgi:hypothetical protein